MHKPVAGGARPRRVCAQWRLYPQIRVWHWCANVTAPHSGRMTGGSGAQCPDYPAGSAGVLAMLAEPAG
ncbi:hypothetical protein MAHJHV51_55340 [Mycobacterium avium subsp. hominissuis]